MPNDDLFGGTLPATRIPLQGQIAEVKRELALRDACYPDWISAGRMSPNEARGYMQAMRAVLTTLEEMRFFGEHDNHG